MEEIGIAASGRLSIRNYVTLSDGTALIAYTKLEISSRARWLDRLGAVVAKFDVTAEYVPRDLQRLAAKYLQRPSGILQQ
jgi:hypothetical protein